MAAIEMSAEEAEAVSFALELCAADARGLGYRLIDGTNSMGAGFNQYDRAAAMDRVRVRIDAVFPRCEDEYGRPIDEHGNLISDPDDDDDDTPFEDD